MSANQKGFLDYLCEDKLIRLLDNNEYIAVGATIINVKFTDTIRIPYLNMIDRSLYSCRIRMQDGNELKSVFQK